MKSFQFVGDVATYFLEEMPAALNGHEFWEFWFELLCNIEVGEHLKLEDGTDIVRIK